ncbi:MAG: MFS transporter [Chromatiales bacterium]
MPYWRLSGFYFFYFGALGALIPFWGLYLKNRGFSSAAIGELMAILMATKIIAPNIWGWISDHTGRRMPVVRLASLLATLTFAGVYGVQGFWGLALVMSLFSFFWNASLPQLEAVTFSFLGREASRYARIRLWGSIGFILTVTGLGAALDLIGIETVPAVVLTLFAGIWVVSLAVPEQPPRDLPEGQGSLWAVLRRPEILAFFAVCFLMQASHGAYYAFYSIHLENQGYASGTIGALWALGVVAEVALFLGMHRVLHRFGARQVVLASLALAALRWVLIGGLTDVFWVLVLAQILHAATFGSFHAAAIYLVHHYFVGRHQVRGQAVYSSASFGAGGALGSLSAGWMWDGAGPLATFLVSAAAAALALAVAWRWVDRGPDSAPAVQRPAR